MEGGREGGFAWGDWGLGELGGACLGPGDTGSR